MQKSFLTTAGILFKKITGISNINLFIKDCKKSVGKLIYHEKYSADMVVNTMKDLGLHEGSVVCIHASMKEFYNYEGTAEELIDKIIEVITPEGTLMMPAFVEEKLQFDLDYIFDSTKDKTAAGYLAETFRKYSGVVRSINIQHSVCAWGKNAKYLTQDHHRCRNCWDEYSPWYRMIELGGLVFTLGLGRNYIGSFDHCVEAILYKEHPYWKQFFNRERTYHYYDSNHNVQEYTCLTNDLEQRSHEATLIRHFSKDMFRKRKISNLLIKRFYAQPCFDTMLSLGRKGITIYYVPSPKKYKF